MISLKIPLDYYLCSIPYWRDIDFDPSESSCFVGVGPKATARIEINQSNWNIDAEHYSKQVTGIKSHIH